ncbi:MAG: GtrA family protein [Clostridia bacterium]|nr:GtrA family protein [Clostridia bacterium]
MLEFLKKHKSVILYIIFGGMTTVVDWSVSFLLYYFWGEAIDATPILLHGANVIAWVAAVAFAYVTNRIWVFESKRKGLIPVVCEIGAFAGGRVLTLLLQEAIMGIFCTWLGLNEYLFKIIAAVLVVILNYFISKLLVFRKTRREAAAEMNSADSES